MKRTKQNRSWFHRLRPADQTFVRAITKELVKDPTVPIMSVADDLIQELKLDVANRTVREGLNSIMREYR